MNIVLYDGSFDGLLTVVFEVYEYKIEQPVIYKNDCASGSLFGTVHSVQTNSEKSKRVYRKLQEKLSKNGLERLYPAFLSEIAGIENTMLRYIQYLVKSGNGVENDYGNADVLMLLQTSKKVHREKHRMEAFVRFRLTADQLYYCIIQPDFNVLPLICRHFVTRYADQRWLIYDCLRKYGLYYNGESVEEVQMSFELNGAGEQATRAIYDEQEELYQKLWQQYFGSVNIAARKNTKLHIQHMPKRYWRYLVEKGGGNG